MKIKSIEIQGFQSHVDTKIELSENLTVITGATDAGKTAILRAIRWVCLGEPLGDSFVNKKIGQASVTLLLQTDYRITKIRKGSTTTYIITTPDGHTEEYQSSKVPEEVTLLTGIKKSTFNDFETTLNFAFQLEPPFLLSESPATGAKVLGKLANVEDIDGALKDVTAEVWKYRDERKQAENQIKELDCQLLQYSDLDELEALIVSCEYLLENIDQMENRFNVLSDLQSKLVKGQAKIEELEVKLDKLAVVPSLAADLINIEESQQRYNRLLSLYSDLGRYELTISNLQQRLSHLQLDGIEDRLKAVEDDYKRYNTLKTLQGSYSTTKLCIDMLEFNLSKFKDADVIQSLISKIEADHKRYLLLSSLHKQHSLQSTLVQKYQSKLSRLKHTGEVAELLDKITINVSQLDKIKFLFEDYKDKSIDVTHHGLTVEYYTKELELANKEYQELWESVDCCPLDGEKVCPLLNKDI